MGSESLRGRLQIQTYRVIPFFRVVRLPFLFSRSRDRCGYWERGVAGSRIPALALVHSFCPPEVFLKRTRSVRAFQDVTCCLTAALVLAFPCYAQTFTPADVQAIAASDTIPNTHLRQALGAKAKLDVPSEVDAQTTKLASTSMAATFRDIESGFEKQRRQYEIGSNILKANDFVVKKALVGGLSASGEGAALAPVVGAVADAGLGYIEKKFDESAQEDLRRLLKTRLDQVQQQSATEYNNLLKIKNPEQFVLQLKADTGSLFGTALDSLPQTMQDEVNEFTIKETSTIMENGFDWVAQTTALQQSEIDQNQKDIVGLGQTFSKFADQMKTQVSTLREQQSQLKDSLTNLQSAVSADHDKLNSVTTFLYARMSPDERLAAINAGLLDGTLSPEKIDVLKKEADLEKKAEDLQRTAGEYLDGAANIVKIAKNLGVSDSVVKPAEEVVQAGQAVFSAVTAFASGNYLGGLASVTSIFGLGGPDVNQERFQEILNRLGVIDQKLDILGQKVDLVLKGEQQILDLQKETYKAIVSVSQEISDSHQEEMNELATIQKQIIVLNNTLLNLATRDFSACTTLVTPYNINNPVIDTNTKLYPSESTLADLYLNFRSSFSECFGHFSHTVQFNPSSGRPQFDPTFFPMTAYRGQSSIPRDEQAHLDQVNGYIEHVYSKALILLSETRIGPLSKDQRISSLFVPVSSAQGLDSKLKSTLQIANARDFNTDQLLDLVATPLSVPEVLAHARAAANIHVYYLFLDAADRPRPWRGLISATDIRTTGKSVLNDARLLLDVALAQQILISGDTLLPLISDVLQNWTAPLANAETLGCYVSSAEQLPQDCKDKFSSRQQELILAGVKEATRKEIYDDTLDLLQSDDILAQNYIRYRLRMDVLAHGSFLSYAVALQQKDDTMLRSVAGPAWTFQLGHDGNTWTIPIGSAKVPLPSPQDMSNGTFLLPSAVQDLLTARDRVVDELATYAPLSTATGDQLRKINSVLLAAAPNTLAAAPLQQMK